jgi:acyl-CoA reductase-like NAD-dependent aldehyde dehydrogenase
MEKVLPRVKAIRQGNPLSPDTMLGAQASGEQLEKILSYFRYRETGRRGSPDGRKPRDV